MIDADGKAAVQEVRRLEKAQKDAGAAADHLGSKTRKAKSGVDSLSASARAADAQIDAMADANQRAAGSMGNLVAQGNDVFTMLIAGQDPLQLAIQQGTQINQIWGQMGVSGAGAFRMVGGAIMSMLSPINLVTIGSIAAAGAMVGWFTSGQEEALSLEERIEAVDAQVSELRETTNRSASDLRDEFGGIGREIKVLNQELAALQLDDVLISATQMSRELSTSLGSWRRSQSAAIESLFNGTNLTEITEAWTLEIAGLLDAVGSADGIDAQLSAIEALQAALHQATGGFRFMNDEQLEFYKSTVETEAALRRAAAARAEFDESSGHAERDARLEYYQSRVQAEEFLKNARAEELASLEEIYGVYVRTREQSDAELASAEEMLAKLRSQNEMQALILEHGADSLEVAEARAASERAVFEEILASLDVSEDLKNQLRAAFEEGLALSQLDVGSGIRGAVADAIELASNLGLALDVASKLANRSAFMRRLDVENPDFFDPRGEGSAGDVPDTMLPRLPAPRLSTRGGGRQAGGGGGRGGGAQRAAETDTEREAVERLLDRLQTQLDILRETDPVQQEMLRNREALKGATDAERASVEDLIETRLREEETLENHKAIVEDVKEIGYDLFTSATQGADALEAAALRAADAIAEMVFQALLLGEGPLGGLVGGNGLLTGVAEAIAGGITGSSLPAKAAGGMIYGAGDGTSDDVLMWGSSGEFVVNARATARHRPLLEQINSGAVPGYAAGGMIPGASREATGWGGGGLPTIIFENHSSARPQGQFEEAQTADGGRALKLVLADQVGRAITQPGGGAKRALNQQFGVKQVGTFR